MGPNFPEVPGYYLWYILDMGYFEIGAVHVMKDPALHLAYLRKGIEGGPRKSSWPGVVYEWPYIYQNSKGETLTMYWEANGGSHPHLPPLLEDRKPVVDEFIPFDFSLLDKSLGRKNVTKSE